MGNWTGPGLGDVGSYQVSGVPFTHEAATSYEIIFKFVTSAITVTCTDQNVGNKINFGPGTSDVFVPQGSTRFQVKARRISVTRAAGTIGVVAELSPIAAHHMTGSIDLDLYGTV